VLLHYRLLHTIFFARMLHHFIYFTELFGSAFKIAIRSLV
jgi:hypothetical protein